MQLIKRPLVYSKSQVLFAYHVHRDMEIGIFYVHGDGPFLAPDGSSNGRLSLHFEVRHHQVPIQWRQIDDGTQIPSSLAPGTASFRTWETTHWELSL